MHTLYDYLTHVKGIEYILALIFVAVYILYAELLKPDPFKRVRDSGREDINFLRKTGLKKIVKTLGLIVIAPFIGLAYVIALPFVFAFALGKAVLNSVLSLARRKLAPFTWRPMEAYLAGRKKRREKEKKEEKK